MKGVGYVDRWIRFGGERGFVSFHIFPDRGWMLFVGQLMLHHLCRRRFRLSLLPFRSKYTGSIYWLRLAVGSRGKA
jgi:hypothetical protein